MALIEQLLPWDRQPQEAVQLRDGFPNAQVGWIGSNPDFDNVLSRVGSVKTGVSFIATQLGMAMSSSGGATPKITFPGRTTAQTKFTIIAQFIKRANLGYGIVFGFSSTHASLKVGSTDPGGTDIGFTKAGIASFGSVTIGNDIPYTVVASHDQNSGTYHILLRDEISGVVSLSSGTNTSVSNAPDGSIAIGGDYALNGQIANAFGAFDFLPLQSAYECIQDPLNFLYAPRSIQVPVSAGGGPAIPTLSNATWINPTQTTARPRVSITI